MLKTSVSAYVRAPNFLLIGHVKITSSTVFNVSCADCTLSNCVDVLKCGMSVMVVYQPTLLTGLNACKYDRILVFWEKLADPRGSELGCK